MKNLKVNLSLYSCVSYKPKSSELSLENITVSLVYLWMNRVRNYRGRVSNFNQSEARKHCFLASDWSKFEYTNFR